jgi:acetyltransferase-like isoleucine patch superfamily enzyme
LKLNNLTKSVEFNYKGGMGTYGATMSKAQLKAAIAKAVRYPHKKVHMGKLVISPEAYQAPGRKTNLVISPFSILDCTGSIHLGPWCNIGPRTRIYTHDAIHMGTRPLLELEETYGVLWQDKHIGTDVWIHDGSFVLYQATHLPDGFVLGAGSVLTKNPGPYEIWAGNPARKIGHRTNVNDSKIQKLVGQKRFALEAEGA